MTTITNVRDIPGFNQSQYDTLVATARGQNIDPAAIDMALLQAVNAGSNFSAALKSVTGDLPRLSLPHNNALSHLGSLDMAPSPGATLMSLITSMAADERKQNAQMRIEETKAIVEKIMDQADEMRNKAIVQLVMGVVSGAISIAQGVASMSMQASAMKQLDGFQTGSQIATQKGLPNMAKSFDAMYQSGMSKLTAQQNALNSGFTAGNSAVAGINQAVGGFFDAAIKEMDGDVERMRASRDAMKQLDDALAQLIQKTLSGMDAIQQNMNQTRTRILG